MGKRNLISVLLLALVMVLLPVILKGSYLVSVLVFVGIYCLITLGLSMLMGYAGQISIGHAAFYGIGAYTSGLLTTRLEMSCWLALVIAVFLGGSLALVIGLPALRLRGHYLAMATLAFGVIVYIFFQGTVDLTGGPSGFGSIPRLNIGKWKINSDVEYYYLVWGFVIGSLVLCLNILHSRVGRALRSIHGSELAAGAMGVDTSRYKIQVFVLSGCLASLAGSLYAHYMTFVSPTPFDFKFSVTLVTMVAVGGMSSLWGAIAGTALLHILPEYLRAFDQYYLLIYGSILIFIMVFLPQGFLLGSALTVRAAFRKLQRKGAAR